MRVYSLLRRALPHSEKHQQARGRRRCASRVCVSPEVRLTQSACVEEAHRWVGVYGEARRALLRLPPALLTRRRVDHNWAALTPSPHLTSPHSEQESENLRWRPSSTQPTKLYIYATYTLHAIPSYAMPMVAERCWIADAAALREHTGACGGCLARHRHAERACAAWAPARWCPDTATAS